MRILVVGAGRVGAQVILQLQKNQSITILSCDPREEPYALQKGIVSKIDIQVLALALDFPNSVIYSDDNAVQNVSAFLNIDIMSQHFKIRNKREYYWKCRVCGEKFSSKVETCIECGSPVKRYFVRK